MNNVNVKLQPFRMHDNIYFIGNERVSVHLIDTEKGLVLIDSGYPDMYELIIVNIEKMGFSPKNISAIFHSHGHIDHYGTTRELVRLSGAKTYISRIDNEIVNGTLDLSWAVELNIDRIPPFDCDVLIEDGDVFDFGNVSIRCVNTPGHTDGVMSYFITLPDGIVAAMHGGSGMNSMKAAFLKQYGLSFDCRRKFKEAVVRLTDEKVDLVLGNHPEQNDTKSKMLKVFGGDADIIDRDEWGRLMASLKRTIDRLAETDPE